MFIVYVVLIKTKSVSVNSMKTTTITLTKIPIYLPINFLKQAVNTVPITIVII